MKQTRLFRLRKLTDEFHEGPGKVAIAFDYRQSFEFRKKYSPDRSARHALLTVWVLSREFHRSRNVKMCPSHWCITFILGLDAIHERLQEQRGRAAASRSTASLFHITLAPQP